MRAIASGYEHVGRFSKGLAAQVPRERMALVMPRTKQVIMNRPRTAWERIREDE